MESSTNYSSQMQPVSVLSPSLERVTHQTNKIMISCNSSSGALLDGCSPIAASNNNHQPDQQQQQLYDHLLRTIAISIQAACMLVALLLAFLVFRYRKYKAIAGSAWILLELMLIGALLLYSIVVVRYFESSADLCLLEPWLRELGFTCCYGTIVLKIYRLLVEFRTRKAHRWVVREKDLLKYWAVMITCVSVYLASGTISTLEHSDHNEHSIWKVWDHSAAAAASADQSAMMDAVAFPSASSSNHSRSTHLLFPKSIKGTGETNSGRVGVRVRVDGSRNSNASFLLQKARVLRRGTVLGGFIDPSHSNVAATGHDDVDALRRSILTDTTTETFAQTDFDADNDTRITASVSAEANQWNNATNKTDVIPNCDVNATPDGGHTGGNSLLYTRFQVDSGSYFTVCRQLWWHYVNMAGEFLFLLCGLYISSNARNAASHHGEKLCLFLAILVEFCASVAYTVLSRIAWITDYPDHLFLLEFARSQLATTLVLIIIFGPKIFFICRQSSNKDLQRMQHQTSQIECGIGVPGDLLERGQSAPCGDSNMFKNNPADGDGAGTDAPAMISANGEVDLGNVDLSQMDPEVIREELKRVYTQLHVLKMKTLRKDNPHISKRRGGRKPPHRRFSLQRSRVQREKSKSSRTVRKPENVEETGVEESVCSLDGPSGVHPLQLTQQQPHHATETTDLLPTEIPPVSTLTASSKTLK
ncbi:probable G-protein coupled receptor 158 [Daphnia magna]|uniref:probable G-protein coupled receptor 158 n=1 Tax=Daphnia magna TaxID=35525 RepID=UPI001E1BCEA7|nr:probable G-protein coupled receptor 158 [Daphnia magna]